MSVAGRGEGIAVIRVVALEKHRLAGVFCSLEHADGLWLLTVYTARAVTRSIPADTG